MPFILPAPAMLFLPEDEPLAAPRDVLVRGAVPAVVSAVVPPAPDSPAIVAALPEVAAFTPLLAPDGPATQTAPPETTPPAPTPATAFTLPDEDAFPTMAELDAILAAHAGPQAGPDAAERAAAAALLGLDPTIAHDQAQYDAAVAAMQDPDSDTVLAAWISEAEAGTPPPEWPDVAGDWQLG